MASFKRVLAALTLFVSTFAFARVDSDDYSWLHTAAPETWFHIIGGNASKEGIVADLDAIRAAGISGIQFFHGQGDGSLWPGVTNPIPCLSEQWIDLVKFISDECHKRHLTLVIVVMHRVRHNVFMNTFSRPSPIVSIVRFISAMSVTGRR